MRRKRVNRTSDPRQSKTVSTMFFLSFFGCGVASVHWNSWYALRLERDSFAENCFVPFVGSSSKWSQKCFDFVCTYICVFLVVPWRRAMGFILNDPTWQRHSVQDETMNSVCVCAMRQLSPQSTLRFNSASNGCHVIAYGLTKKHKPCHYMYVPCTMHHAVVNIFFSF